MAAGSESIIVGSLWERRSDHRRVVVTGHVELGYGMSDVYWAGTGGYIGTGRCGSHVWLSRYRPVEAA
ncbi:MULTISPECIES: hypothetical protein [Leifsonia]|jgi:hypothetical protein|uniref:Uncharacterized protein n=3 Tax=Leifsonia TaxID=110932 RepID=U2T636_LEIAQ|nr:MULTISPECIES: hypothetical protein [Leifsonia]ERK72923.1 hypothetical protein N136_00713 [Leifsonia aquatica ATCC 14665]MBB2967799.1 hypothetical protein [Leifsonia aquatica]NYK10048.1 hypothetical protein [Leifsonia naganoensis]